MKGVDLWLVVGGRRWAKVIASELCALLCPSQFVYIQGSHEDVELCNWRSSSPYKDRIKIVEQVDLLLSSKVGVAIIANSAYLHYSSIESAFKAGYNVVSEKPLAFTGRETKQLLSKAEELGLKLFSTNTYVFADYLRVFRQNWLADRSFNRLHIDWADAIAEIRYGDKKGYDSSVPIIYDVLPHVASIILACYGEVKVGKSIIKILKGGSEVELVIECNELIITLDLSRNSLKRRRYLRFSGNASEVSLDFTEEPGVVTVNGATSVIINDRDWALKRKPIAEMLFRVKEYFEDDLMDNRLSCSSSLLANELIDRISGEYVDQQIHFLNSVRHQKVVDNIYFKYALKESISLKKRVLQHLPLESPLRRLALEPQHLHDKLI